jgi:hypothetical protein
MLRVAGWVHDASSTNAMLPTEAGASVIALAAFALVAKRVPGRAADDRPHKRGLRSGG